MVFTQAQAKSRTLHSALSATNKISKYPVFFLLTCCRHAQVYIKTYCVTMHWINTALAEKRFRIISCRTSFDYPTEEYIAYLVVCNL